MQDLTLEQARIILLEQQLDQSAKTIEFMHGCLTSEHYDYAYSDQTIKQLEAIRKLVPESPVCFHSMSVKDCESCIERVQSQQNRHQAKVAFAKQEVQDKKLATGKGFVQEKPGIKGIEVFKTDKWQWKAFEIGKTNGIMFAWEGDADTEEQAIAEAIAMVGLV